MRNGQGSSFNSTSISYMGTWKDDARHGTGKHYWPDGCVINSTSISCSLDFCAWKVNLKRELSPKESFITLQHNIQNNTEMCLKALLRNGSSLMVSSQKRMAFDMKGDL